MTHLLLFSHLYLSVGSGNAFLSGTTAEGFAPQNTIHSLPNTVRCEPARRGPASVCRALLLSQSLLLRLSVQGSQWTFLKPGSVTLPFRLRSSSEPTFMRWMSIFS